MRALRSLTRAGGGVRWYDAGSASQPRCSKSSQAWSSSRRARLHSVRPIASTPLAASVAKKNSSSATLIASEADRSAEGVSSRCGPRARPAQRSPSTPGSAAARRPASTPSQSPCSSFPFRSSSPARASATTAKQCTPLQRLTPGGPLPSSSIRATSRIGRRCADAGELGRDRISTLPVPRAR